MRRVRCTIQDVACGIKTKKVCKHANVSFEEFHHLIKVFPHQNQERQHGVPISIQQMLT